MARRREPEPGDEDDRFKSGNQLILQEAKERFKRAQDWEGAMRRLYIDDLKFANGDSDNGWQWPDNVKQDRDVNMRPCLTVNKTKTIVLRLANEAKQNPPEPRVKPVGDKVSFEAAQVWEGLLRHIFYVSNGQAIFGQAKENQLEGGIGYWHVNHDFVDDRSFDQEIRLGPLDPMNVFMDCDIKTVDGADAMWGFIFDEYNRKEFRRLFPNISLPPQHSPGLDDKDDWIQTDSVRVAQYYRIKITEDELVYIEDEEGNPWIGLRSEIPSRGIWRRLLKEYEEGKQGANFKKRTVKNRQLEWYKIAGSEIIESRTDLKGKYVPIIREPGRERRIENRLYRAGIVRALKDPQRMYNYNTSGEVEVVALQTKSPWVVALAAIEGNEDAWAKSNTTNAAYLAYKHIDDEGEPIPPPERKDPPTPAQGFLEGLRISAAEMEMASGLQSPQQQNPALERTPRAIDERMRSGEITNYDFTHNEMQAMRHTAVVILDLAPHIYDTARVVKMRAKDGTIRDVHLDPDAEEAYREEHPDGDDKAIKVLFNPSIGKYAVEADVGPAYQTQRQEAWHAFVEITSKAPEMTALIGDLGFLAADFPMAQEIADRIRRNIEQTTPWVLKDSQTGPLIQKLTGELQQSQKQAAELMEKLTENRIKERGKAELRDIEVEDMRTRRLSAEGGVVKDLLEINEAGGLRHLIAMTLGQMMGWSADEIEAANEKVIKQQQQGAPNGEASQGAS